MGEWGQSEIRRDDDAEMGIYVDEDEWTTQQKGDDEIESIRTNAGLARTVANGTKLGRKSVLTPSIKRKILDAKKDGASIRKIAGEVGVNRGAVQRFLQVA